MKKFILLFLLLSVFFINSCNIQPISVPNNRIYGTVNCNDGTSPVGTIVSLETVSGFPISTFSITSLNGSFTFNDLSSGDYKVYASLDVNADGIDDYSGTYGGDSSAVLTLFGGDTLSISITLKRIVVNAYKPVGSRNR